MCLGVPMQVLIAGERSLVCDDRGTRTELDAALVGAQPPGTWVLASRGCAVRVLEALEAQRIGAALAGLEAVLSGATNVDAFFADLIERETQSLPPGVRETAP